MGEIEQGGIPMGGKPGRSGRKPKVMLAPGVTIQLPTVDNPTPPEWLGEIGQERFHELLEAIRKAGHICLTACDIDAVSAYAEAWEDFLDAQASIDQHGAEIWGFDAQGNKVGKANPAVRRKNQAANRIRQGMSRFGLSPADRAGLKVQAVDRRPDEFGGFLGDVASA